MTVEESTSIQQEFFSVYLRDHLCAPVPMQNTLIFPQFHKKNSQSENKF